MQKAIVHKNIYFCIFVSTFYKLSHFSRNVVASNDKYEKQTLHFTAYIEIWNFREKNMFINKIIRK